MKEKCKEMGKCIIFGAGGHILTRIQEVLADGWQIVALCDTNIKECMLGGYTVLSKVQAIDICLEDSSMKIVIGAWQPEMIDKIMRDIYREFPENVEIVWKYWLSDIERRVKRLDERLQYVEKLMQEIPNNLFYLSENQNSDVSNRSKPKRKEKFISIEQAYNSLKEKCPTAYEIWRGLFENGYKSYVNDPGNNLMVDESVHAHELDDFLKLYVNRNDYILDIGCGPEKKQRI